MASVWQMPTRADFPQVQVAEPVRPPAQIVSALSDLLQEAVIRLASGPSVPGATQVRLEFKADFLPGVTAIFQKAGGRIQVDFFCAVEASRQLLGAITRREVGEVARRCRRDLLLRIHAHDEEQAETSSVLELLGNA